VKSKENKTQSRMKNWEK